MIGEDVKSQKRISLQLAEDLWRTTFAQNLHFRLQNTANLTSLTDYYIGFYNNTRNIQKINRPHTKQTLKYEAALRTRQ